MGLQPGPHAPDAGLAQCRRLGPRGSPQGSGVARLGGGRAGQGPPPALPHPTPPGRSHAQAPLGRPVDSIATWWYCPEPWPHPEAPPHPVPASPGPKP